MIPDSSTEDSIRVWTRDPTDVSHASTSVPRDELASPIQGGLASTAAMEPRLGPYCARAEPRRRALTSLRGLLSTAERSNRWPLAESSGEAAPYGVQHLLGRAAWEPDAVRDERRRDLLQQLGEADAVLVLDATGVLKKGRHAAGVARP